MTTPTTPTTPPNPGTALLTGSYGGLGTCFAQIHARRGGDLVLVGRSQDKLDAQAAGLTRTYGITARTIAVDLSTPEAAETIHAQCQEWGIVPDLLINNAGFGGQGDFSRERTMDQDLSMIAVNIETPTRLAKLFLPEMIERGSGRLLNVSSTAALLPGPLQAVYYATKAYVTSWSNALWHELKGTGVTVTALMPGAMQTGFISTGGLSETKMFANAVDPMKVAQDGYDGALAGELNVVSGLPRWQKPMMTLAPVLPRKAMMGFVADQQSAPAR
ncbi:SDR family NAD(P)-dependent oxidoreductase [Actinomyces haliotis]|uniref:SDR family NAD(P)-dependent oxidoreductase n=1 Tax=Actinomyces haliotis TaxID=1280843 RepID=UPI00188F0615|nr:SDR family oxidoreductase [Actinomyces haliotis]